MPHLPKTIKHKDKLFREAGFNYADCKGYKNGRERILVKPTGEVCFHYIMQDSRTRGF